MNYDWGNLWWKPLLVFVVVVVLPVWILRFVDISFLYKIAFTIVGAIAIYWTFESGKTINIGRKR